MAHANIVSIGDDQAHINVQWGTESVSLVTYSDGEWAGTVVFTLEVLDKLIAALLRARGGIAKQKRATLYARVPHSLKSEFLAKAQEEGLTQNAAIIQAVRRFLDPLVDYLDKGGLPK